MAGLLPPDVVFALRSLRDSYMRHRQSAGGQDVSAKAAFDRLVATVDGALSSGEAPIAQISSSLRSSAKFLSYPIARLSRGEMVRLLGIGSAMAGGSNRDWWHVQSRSGVTGWIPRREIFPDVAAVLSSQAGMGGSARQPEEIELGVRDTMIR